MKRLVFGVAGCVVVGLGVALWLGQRAAGPTVDALEEELDACRAAGMTMDRADLVPPAVPEADNGAPALAAAAEAVRAPSEWPQEVRDGWQAAIYTLGEAWTAEERSQAQAVVTYLEDVLGKVDAACRKPRFRANIDYSAAFPDAGDLLGTMNLGRALAMRGRLQVARGDGGGALVSAGSAIGLAESRKDEPMIMSFMARAMVLGQASGLLERVLDARNVGPEALAAIDERLPRRESIHAQAQRALNGEMLCLLGDGISQLRPLKPGLQKRLLSEDLVFCLGRFRRNWVRAGTARHAWPDAGMTDPEPGRGLWSSLLPSFWRVLKLRDVAVAQVEMARIAVALERRRAADGACPESLDALRLPDGQAPPEDPFGGRPYRYERAGDGYRLWSVGPDLKDDGGEEPADTVFAVRVPEVPAESAGATETEAAGKQPTEKPSPTSGSTSWREYWRERMDKKRREEQGGGEAAE